MPLKESLSNILKAGRPAGVGEFATPDEAFEWENRVAVAFLRGKISVGEYYALLEETYPLTNTDFRELAMESDKRQ